MAEIFISYTSHDRDWAFWIGHELEVLGHVPHIHEWEISAGGNIAAWMEERHNKADHILCVISEAYLAAPYSSWERQAAQWAAATERPNFALPVFIENCRTPTLLAPFKRCDLAGVSEERARVRLAAFLAPAVKPDGPMSFPGHATATAHGSGTPAAMAFPGKAVAISNIPIRVPEHFLGRDEALKAIETSLARTEGRVAITAVHGLRGVGKTTLAAAYAENHRHDYRATWWIRAQTEPTLRADLAALGVRLKWVDPQEKEEPALDIVLERLRQESEGLLLIYDNAMDAASLKDYLPRGGAAKVLITSNAPNWRRVAEPIEIRLWPSAVGADYLLARIGGEAKRTAAEALSQKLGGLPLAHEQAAAYCERLEIPLAEYTKRFEASPAKYLDAGKDAPTEYHDGLTVAKTFALAIAEASKLHPGAEPLIIHAALLAPEPIPLFLFSEAREKFGEPLASALEGDGLDEAVAALRTFALVDREAIADEREPEITTDCLRLHRLVRQVAASRCEGAAKEGVFRTLIEAMAAVYPDGAFNDSQSWPRARRLDTLALALVGRDVASENPDETIASLLNGLAAFRFWLLGAYAEAQPLAEWALAIREKACGPEHPSTAESLNNLASLVQAQGDHASARPLVERALAILEKALGPEHPSTAESLNGLANLLQAQGDLVGARPLYERALAIWEKALGPEHPSTAMCLNNLATLLRDQGDLAAARPLFERALVIHEKALGPDHPDTNAARGNLARLLLASNLADEALPLAEAALAAHEEMLGRDHPWTKTSAAVTADALAALVRSKEATELRARYNLATRSSK